MLGYVKTPDSLSMDGHVMSDISLTGDSEVLEVYVDGVHLVELRSFHGFYRFRDTS